MKNLNFKYISAKNFLCFGPDGIEVNFEDYGNIVLIRGNNLDVKDEDGKTSSNGVGKSSILEILSYGLFGKTIKYPKKVSHKDVINNQICKKLEIEAVDVNEFVLNVKNKYPENLFLLIDETQALIGEGISEDLDKNMNEYWDFLGNLEKCANDNLCGLHIFHDLSSNSARAIKKIGKVETIHYCFFKFR